MTDSAQSTTTTITKPETLCLVCGDKASGKHYGVLSCDGCRGFFKRSIRRNLAYVCKENGNCIVDVNRRNQCQSCRFRKCLEANMKREAVQHERAPRLTCAPKTNFAGGMSDAEEWPSSTNVPNFFSYNIVTSERPTTCTPLVDDQRGDNNVKFSRSSCQTVETKEHVAIYEVNSTHTSESTNNLVLPYTHEYLSGQQFVMTPDALLYAESVHESAARLLFLAVKWTRGVPAFLHLPFRDQAILLEEAWAELFVINAAQWSLPVDDGILLGNSGIMSLNCQTTLLTEIRLLRETIHRFTTMDIDNTEYACLKALVLFKPEVRGLRDPIQVEILQDQTHLMLQEYAAIKQPASKMRFGKLLLLLPAVHSIRASAIEDVFFRKTIGSIPIERLLCDMFKSS